MTTTAIEKQDASTTVAALTARLADAQERLAATGPEHDRLRQERRDAFEAGQDTEPLDGHLARLDRDAQDLEAIIGRVSAELEAATATQMREAVVQARLARARAGSHHADVAVAARDRILAVMREELGKEAIARSTFEEAHGQLGRLEKGAGPLFYNAILGQLAGVAETLATKSKDLDIEQQSAHDILARLEAAS